jgi:ribosomal protein L37AE/L43A
MASNADLTIYRTSNPDCPACREKRLHRAHEWDAWHPESGASILDGVYYPKAKDAGVLPGSKVKLEEIP